MDDYTDIAPYPDEEIPRVLEHILNNKDFLSGVGEIVYPRIPYVLLKVKRNYVRYKIKKLAKDIKTIDDYQHKLLNGVIIDGMLEHTVDEFTSGGYEHLDPERAYLFISNHRDIALDPTLMNYALAKHNFPFTEITFGDNLMVNNIMGDIIRMNRGVVVKRTLSLRDRFIESNRLSNYFVKRIKEGRSMWVAQKSGRAKDGIDETNPAIIKMLHMSQKDKGTSFEELLQQCPIVPVAISYQYDPCDIRKSRELLYIKMKGYYKKKKLEDLVSVFRGVRRWKGNIHIQFGTPITGGFSNAEETASEIDRQIHLNYRLWDSNYIAYDVLHGTADYKEHYSEAKKIKFLLRYRGLTQEMKEYVLGSYANPLIKQKEAAARNSTR